MTHVEEDIPIVRSEKFSLFLVLFWGLFVYLFVCFLLFLESNHRIVECPVLKGRREPRSHTFKAPGMDRNTFHWITLLRAPSNTSILRTLSCTSFTKEIPLGRR